MELQKRGWTLPVLFAVSCGVIAVALALALYEWHLMQYGGRLQAWDKELFKVLAQFVAVVVIGGAVKFGYDRLESARSEERAQDEIIRDFVQRVGTAYRNAKRVRRCLRAKGLSEHTGGWLTAANWRDYFDLMCKLNDAQLSLESLEIEAENLPEGDALRQAAKDLGRMQGYLHDIVDEVGNKVSEDGIANEAVEIEKALSKLHDFTRKYDDEMPSDEYRFGRKFKEPHKRVVKLLSALRLHRSQPRVEARGRAN